MADRMTNPPDHWVMDLDSATGWRPAAPFPQSRGHFPGVEVGGQIFALGGAFHHDPTPRDVALVHRYDPATDHWTQLTPAPTPDRMRSRVPCTTRIAWSSSADATTTVAASGSMRF